MSRVKKRCRIVLGIAGDKRHPALLQAGVVVTVVALTVTSFGYLLA